MPKYISTRMKIIDSIIVLIAVGYLIYATLIHRPQMKIIIRYKDVPAISTNLWLYRIDTHYRGFDVGDVTKINLSKDQNYIEFHVSIYYKDLKLPKNTYFVFKTENLYGSRYIDIQPAQNPSKKFIVDGDIVKGVTAYERFDEYMLAELKSGTTGKLINNLKEITDVVSKSLGNKKNEKLLNQSAGDLAIILENLKEVAQDPGVKTDIKSTIKLSSSSLKNIDEILEKEELKEIIYNAPESINTTITTIKSMNDNLNKVSQTIPEVNKSVNSVNVLLADTNNNLEAINCKVPPISPVVVENANKLLVKTDCFESEISKILTKRFLILKLIFGNPGKSFRNCVKKECGCPNEVQ